MNLAAPLMLFAALLLPAAAAAQVSRVRISDKATYTDALTCYQYYTIASEMARKLEKAPNASADAAAGFELHGILARQALTSWSKHLGDHAGARNRTQIDADVKRVGAPIIADANAALSGDKAAAQRGVARSKSCARHEIVDRPPGPRG